MTISSPSVLFKLFRTTHLLWASLILGTALLLSACQTSTNQKDGLAYEYPDTVSPWERHDIQNQAQQTPQTIENQAYNSQGKAAPIGSVQSIPVDASTYAQADGQIIAHTGQYNNQSPALQDRVLNAPATNQYGQQQMQPLYQQQGYTPSAQTQTIGARNVKVALLLPLSGQHSQLGQSMLQAAQLALFDMNYTNIELIPRDTKGTNAGARQAAEQAINDGAQLLLGPIFANAVKGAKEISNRYGVPMIGFSTDWRVAGGNTLIMGVLPFAQAERMANFAASQNWQRIGIIAPSDAYGEAVVSAFKARANQLGLSITAEERFTAGSNNITAEVRRFAKYDARQQKLEAEKSRLKAAGQTQALSELESALTSGDAPYDAILVPVGGAQAKSLINLLSYYDLGTDKVAYLGTGLWDDSSIHGEPAANGAFYSAPSPEARRSFETNYEAVYGQVPPRLVSLAYDATALAVILAKQGIQRAGAPDFSPQAILNPNGFSGIDGIFRFRRDGLVERALAVHQITNGGSKVVDSAATTFQSGQF